MQVSVRFLAHVSAATLPRHTSPKPTLAILRDDIEIRDVDATDYPLVARGVYGEAEVKEYRYRDLVFLKRLRILTGRSIENSLIDHFWKQTFVKQAQAAASVFRLNDIVPKGVATTIIKGRPVATAKLERVGRVMQLTAAGETEVETARAEFNALLTKAVVIDGEIWVPTPEPMLSVDRIFDRPITLNETYFTNVRMHQIPNNHSLGRWLYTFNQIDEALAFDRPYNSNAPLTVEVFEPSVFSDEVPVGFSLSLLRYLSEQKDFPKAHRTRLAAFVNSDDARDWDDVIVEIDRLLSSDAVEGDYRRSLVIELERIDNRKIVAPFSVPGSECPSNGVTAGR